jgi:Fur family peroxide stress response transcriptional regulator
MMNRDGVRKNTLNKRSTCSVEERVKQFSDICRERNLKVTHQRLEIYRTLACSGNHPSAEDIHSSIREKLPTVSLDTVYRTLALFEEHGLITRVHQLDDKNRFDPNLEEHHHFICIRCKKIFDFHWPDFDLLSVPVQAEQWGRINSKKVELNGICMECMKQQKKSAN